MATLTTESKLGVWDFVAIAVYFTAVIGAGLYSMRRANRGTVSGYFLAGRYMIWLPVGASLFASNIGSEHFIGLAGSGAASGLAVGAFELNACILLQLLGWLFLPVYIASGVCTLPEYMKKRFGGTRIRMYLASLSLLLYIFTKVSVNLYSGALFINQALNWDIYVSVFGLLLATAITTVTGGLAAVMYTDTLQAFVMVAGAFSLMIISFVKVGGYKELYYRYMTAIPNSTLASNTTCGYPSENAWIMLRGPADKDLPWPGFLFGQTPASVWYWCADQMMVQRALASKSLSHAQGGTLFAGYLKLLPLFLMVMPGMISRVLFTNEVACADPDECFAICQNRAGCTNIAYPKLVLELLPTGLKGILLSVMVAALMSDLTSIFNSASTLFTMDIYSFIRKDAKTRELMIVGRAFVCVMVVVGIVWIPVIQTMQGGQLFIYIQVISAYLAPPIAAVFLIAVLWKRANEHGAFWGLMAGFVIGVVRMALDFAYSQPGCEEEDTRPIILQIHYMYFATFLFWLTTIMMVVISLFTKPPTEEQIIRTTYWTRFNRKIRSDEIIPDVDEKDKNATHKLINGAPAGGGDVDDRNNIELKAEYSKENGNVKDDMEKVLITKSPNEGGGDGPETAENSKEVSRAHTVQSDVPQRGLLRRGYDWFCGFDDTEEGQRSAEEQRIRLQKLTSLKQDPRAKRALIAALVVLVSLDIFLYIFFSTGSSFGLL